MGWRSFFNEIFVINLTKRTDRLLQITEDFEQYQIPFTRFQAVEAHNGAEGLRDTMLLLFNECLSKNYDNILVFEDDAKVVQGVEIFNDTMDKVIAQLPQNYHLCFLGGQPTGRFSGFYSPNLLPVRLYFSTHAVMYSKQGMKEIMAREMDFPIDNWYVKEIESLGQSYCTHPLLFSQYAGYSDIGKNEIDWSPFIIPRHEQRINELNAGR